MQRVAVASRQSHGDVLLADVCIADACVWSYFGSASLSFKQSHAAVHTFLLLFVFCFFLLRRLILLPQSSWNRERRGELGGRFLKLETRTRVVFGVLG